MCLINLSYWYTPPAPGSWKQLTTTAGKTGAESRPDNHSYATFCEPSLSIKGRELFTYSATADQFTALQGKPQQETSCLQYKTLA
jgi:hypothetical protein